MISSTLPLLLPFLPQALSQVTDLFQGTGTLTVLNLTTYDRIDTLHPVTDRIGCINAQGFFTLSDCAVFTKSAHITGDQILSTTEGPCTFRDKTAEENTKSYFGKGMYALSCGAEVEGDSFFTINGFPFPYVCVGNMACSFETKRVPVDEKDVVPVWEFAWGAHQLDGTPGYLQVVLLWEPVAV